MKMSEKRKEDLYHAIAARIMDLRIEICQNPDLVDGKKLDARLFDLEQQIWPDVKKVLNIKGGTV